MFKEKVLKVLERRLAFKNASSTIAKYCPVTNKSGQHFGRWYRVDSIQKEHADEVATAVLYLLWTNKIKRHPENKNLLKIH